MNCHCGTGKDFDLCCRRFLCGDSWPETAEELMRARYSAYVESEEQFLLDSWHPLTCPSHLTLVKNQRWVGLEVLVVTLGGRKDLTGTVEFVAKFKVSGKVEKLHEVSEFVREKGQWVYLAGKLKN